MWLLWAMAIVVGSVLLTVVLIGIFGAIGWVMRDDPEIHCERDAGARDE